MKHELQSIISGKIPVRNGTAITTVAGYLKGSQRASTLVKKDKHYKSKETENLKEFNKKQIYCFFYKFYI